MYLIQTSRRTTNDWRAALVLIIVVIATCTIAIFTKSSRYYLRKSFKQTSHSAYFVHHRAFECCCEYL